MKDEILQLMPHTQKIHEAPSSNSLISSHLHDTHIDYLVERLFSLQS